MASQTAIRDPHFTGQGSMMDPAKFYHQFEQTVIGLQEQISQLGSIAPVGGERHDATEAIQAGITNLTQQVSDASDSIPRYDQRHYSEVW
ncbi:tubulin-specific chaperone C [Magnaporthiopsis poae ATCC 64411]|uniref:Tubulin-specific chaperone C n=1 Tax=Magnaporthiopsis poae (strain ATCC 64411 / 73-15) TaxID=644358 RepID=A0A0C4DUV0_MAGP6|nr:tubulin-specific chaperone C [Magnaporthiopsis poae ATCC 64411]